MKWIKDLVSPKTRSWEEFYRNRWQHDKVVRSTHGVNCTGGCSWSIYVKEGIVTWEMQALDYPLLDRSLPPYEPRGCQRGISYSWYIYSPIRVKYPYVRGALLDLWREAKERHADPVEAWASLQKDPEARSRYQRARGKGGFRRVALDEALELIAAANVHTAKAWGPDRVVGFSPIPAMSQLSYAAGSRFLQLFGGVNLSFYDWYCDLPPASPEIWGEQTDVAESADWYHSKMIAVMGSNPNMTRTPDCHFLPEARHNGTKLVVLSPDFSQVSKYADQWIPLHQGQDGAFWMAVSHVILKEWYAERTTPSFEAYLKQYSDAPFLVALEPTARGYRAGRLLHASQVAAYEKEENPDWKFLVLDGKTGALRLPGGTVGHRWGKEDGKWNLKLEDAFTGEPIDPVLTLLGRSDETLQVEMEQYEAGNVVLRGVPAMTVETTAGRKVRVTTVFDLLMARYGVSRGLPGESPASYDDPDLTYTPAWQERYTGIDRKTVVAFAREWAATAERTGGKCSIIIGAGINHWYHNNLMYRSGIVALILTGCVGKNGGGLNHYVGQEKLAPVAPWSALAFARDWGGPPRLQNAPSWHYMHCDQWRYEAEFTEYHPVPGDASLARGHTADLQVKAVRNGWLPFFPQWNESSLEVARKARAAGAKTEAEVVENVVDRMKSGDLKLAVADPDAPENWPRVWFIWRGNALMSSAKGHEYFLKHYLGTHTNLIAKERAKGLVNEVVEREAPEGKLDLVVDLNFRMDTSALYSDVVLPAATWYEKADLNSTDLHSFLHPLSAAVPPSWESRSDWDLFRAVAAKTAELSMRHFPEPVEDVVMTALAHDSAAEIAQVDVRDWGKGECAPVPGKTMPSLKVVTRDYRKLLQRFTALGPGVREGIGAHGVKLDVKAQLDELVATRPTTVVDGERLPSIREAEQAADVVLHLAPETNGEVAWDGYRYLERRTGLPLADLAEGARSHRVTYKDLQSQPRRILNSPCWSGLVTDGRSYSAFTTQVDRLVPWRTLTGRQHLYLDHPGYLDFGEHLPTYKPVPTPAQYGDLKVSPESGILLNYLTPHGKWHIHSTYYDNHRMLTLSRGMEPLWINDRDAEEIGVADNDWVEAHNDHGVVCTRAAVSARIPRGACILYHSPERTIGVPKSPLRGGRRAGGHNSLTRIRLKPVLMVGGYGQFTFHFNYWGPTGVNRDTSIRVRKLAGKPQY
ncbi:MAG: nitrate reductase subunit alpha [Acidobacteria bacterium]|nr:MAG: nitrate reductase subunit alpha [Acidobacteriota bacterium]MCE7956798.1 nitrate reductase subunit alpha [Acidobacteria bacterium ACB2]